MPRGVYPRTPEILASLQAAAEQRTVDTGVCRVDGCGKPSSKKRANICEVHYMRWRRTGRYDLRRWRVTKPSYTAAHTRTRTTRGSASTHDCIDCEAQGAHWSFAWRRVDSGLWLWGEVNGSWLAYTGNPSDYDPRCHRCARRYDTDFAREGWRQTRKEQATR